MADTTKDAKRQGSTHPYISLSLGSADRKVSPRKLKKITQVDAIAKTGLSILARSAYDSF